MANTAQRSGFRLPWTADSHAEAVPDAQTEVSAVLRIGEAGTAQGGSISTDKAGPSSVGDIPEGASTKAADPLAMPWPTSDASRASDAPGGADIGRSDDPTTTEHEATPRQVNPLVAGLVRAMRDAAEIARQEAMTRFAETVKARKEQIQAELTENDAENRRTTDHDIAGIREWSKAQMARVRTETDERIATRRQRLELDAEDQAGRVERRLDNLRAAVGTYENRMEAFFRTLLAEDDPARLAGFAEQMPEPPNLANETALADWTPSRTLDPTDAAAAEAAALSDIDLATVFDGDALDGDAGDAGAGDGTDGSSDRKPSDSATAGGDSSVTQLSVVGLISVASIAGFKRAIAKAAGIDGVSVASGPGGDFVFTVRHGSSVDIGELVAGLEGFNATVKSNEEGVLSVTASEPAGLG